MVKLIVNADDFGYSPGVNYGIIDCYQQGMLTSTTMMANMPGFVHGVELAKENQGLGIGVHMTLTCGRPLLDGLQTIVDESGKFKPLSFYQQENFQIDTDELYREWDAQIREIFESGITPTHLDSHHHTHTMGSCREVAVSLAREYQLPIRDNFPKEALVDLAGIKKVAHFVDDFDYTGLQKEYQISDQQMSDYFQRLLTELPQYESAEIMCHPAYLDRTIYEGSSLNMARIIEADILMHSDFSKKIRASETIKLATYADL
ncbi:carbohydrate deacetylase [Listeria costaricensis]|uniref:carbohydrate deacetylase n=1 Tax=Listeria costaricensis TaxID=2026604 RepID=UPI000C07A7E7|nr:carbohydrate deacetylase [Listeria costaricensis]